MITTVKQFQKNMKMKYQIKYFYQTGNSFGSENAEGILELEWENLDVAKANLKRIAAHEKMKRELDNLAWEVRMGKKIVTDAFEAYKGEDWFVDENGMQENCIIFYTDSGKPWRIWAPWCGYFERLYSAKIIAKTPEENDMEFIA